LYCIYKNRLKSRKTKLVKMNYICKNKDKNKGKNKKNKKNKKSCLKEL